MEHQLADRPDTDAVVTPMPELTPTRREALTNMARRHPATVALVEEITAQVNAQAERRIELAQAAFRQSLIEQVSPFAGVGIGALGVFASANLLLVTLTLALAQLMVPWLAGLLVSALTFAAVSAFAIRTSRRRGWQIPFVRRFTARKFAERLSAIA